ncbi:macro domain-containing protein [Enorma sp.]|uniref:macro domain-containing protein n=1 Tax=Enorma sp. TaxID=1920692 RepID=UPI0025C50A86|nr:macro domain-containing protein [Enorma sp.]
MPFSIVRNDIARVHADVLVNAANTRLAEGGGVCGALFAAAGREQMRAACDAIGGCPTGSAVVTPAFNLPARWCVHAVGPIWRGGRHGEEAALRSCYQSMFARVAELGARSVAYPLISAGIYGYPAEAALAVARDETRAFLAEHDDIEVTLVVFDRSTVRLGSALEQEIREYIDDEYVAQSPHVRRRGAELEREARWAAGAAAPAAAKPEAEDAESTARKVDFFASSFAGDDAEESVLDGVVFRACSAAAPAPAAGAAPTELEDLLEHLDAGFSETLLALIDQRGLADAEVYHRANLSRQLFSKIRSNPAYRPTKPTAVALAMALELDVPATQDLLSRAGLTLSRTSKFDVIVRFFLERGIYDIYQLNEALFAYDQPLVGSF